MPCPPQLQQHGVCGGGAEEVRSRARLQGNSWAQSSWGGATLHHPEGTLGAHSKAASADFPGIMGERQSWDSRLGQPHSLLGLLSLLSSLAGTSSLVVHSCLLGVTWESLAPHFPP